MRRALIIAFLGVASAGGFLVVATTPASATTNPTTTTLPAVQAAKGVPALMTATIAPSGAGSTQITGTVSFDAGGTPIMGCTAVPTSPVGPSPNAQAQCDITFNATGPISMTAVYSGDGNWTTSTSTPPTVVNVLEPATVTASAPAGTAMINQPVQLSTTVSGSFGTPTGTVNFYDANSNLLCPATLGAGGMGSCMAMFAAGGTHNVTANYQGNSTYANSTASNSFGTATVNVAKPATATAITAVQELPISPSQLPPGVTAYSMNFTASVTASVAGPNLGGSMTFTIAGQPIASCTNEAVSGVSPQSVVCTDTNPEDFGGPVVANYSNDPHWADSSSAPVSPNFTQDPTSISAPAASPPSPVVGQSMILSAQVTAYVNPTLGPIGVVSFNAGSTHLCSGGVNSSFIATCQTSGLPSGTSMVTATYEDPEGYASSTSAPTSITVRPTLFGVVGIAATPDGGGYWIARSDGAVSAFGDAPDDGSMFGQPLNKPIVGIASTPDGGGYWLVASDGGIFSFGDAHFYGSAGAMQLNKPIVGMTSTHDGKGYFFVASDGGVFAYGDARFQGSMGGSPLNQPVVGMAIDGMTGGYWLVAADGGVFSFDAPFLGSTGAMPLNKPIVGMEAAPDGSGYRFVASDGGVFSYGLPFEGSTGAIPLNQPVVGMAPDGVNGYWLVARDGGLFNFNAPFLGAATY